MEQNYYEILEVNKNASQEIIEKAYKTLVKKYHPDLQINEQKIKYEEKIKKINEAYDILSDSEKRKNYDINLKNTEVSINDYNILYQENLNLKNTLNILEQKITYINNTQKNNNKINYGFNYIKNNNKNYNHKNNLNNLNNYNYSINPINIKNLLKNLLAVIFTIFIILFISFILWHIPFFKNYIINIFSDIFN